MSLDLYRKYEHPHQYYIVRNTFTSLSGALIDKYSVFKSSLELNIASFESKNTWNVVSFYICVLVFLLGIMLTILCVSKRLFRLYSVIAILSSNQVRHYINLLKPIIDHKSYIEIANLTDDFTIIDQKNLLAKDPSSKKTEAISFYA